MITYSTRNTTLKKNNLKDVDVVVLADGYNGLNNFALIDAYGHLYTNTFDAYGTGISSTNVSGKQGLDVFLLNPFISVTQGTSPWVISGTVTATEDKNYGTVGANTLRTAAQIGNATGAADFNVGTIGAQTLRTASHTVDGYGNLIASTSGALNAYTIQGTSPWVVSGTVAATQSGVWTTGRTWTLASGTDSVTVIQGTSPWVISGTVTAAEDKNYGTVGANTLRTAAQIGNATGAVNFNYGAVSAQTLRTSSQIGNATGAANFNYGAVSAQTLRTASQIGNATGAADFNVGTIGAQTLRVASHTVDGYGNRISSVADALKVNFSNTTIGVTQSTSPWVVSGTVTTSLSNDTNYGTVGANTLRTAAQIGNATGAADFNLGATSAQTLRTTSNLNDGYGIQIQSTAGSLNVNLTNIPTVNQGTSPWVVSGTVTANQGGTWTVTAAEDKNYGTVGANTLRTAAQIGNSTGTADFNLGSIGAQTLRTASHTVDGYGVAISSSNHPTKSITALDTRPIKGAPEHFNGTVGTSAITITPTTTSCSILISNPATNGSTEILSVSFDGGAKYFGISRLGSLGIETEIDSFMIKGSSASVDYQIIVTYIGV